MTRDQLKKAMDEYLKTNKIYVIREIEELPDVPASNQADFFLMENTEIINEISNGYSIVQ